MRTVYSSLNYYQIIWYRSSYFDTLLQGIICRNQSLILLNISSYLWTVYQRFNWATTIYQGYSRCTKSEKGGLLSSTPILCLLNLTSKCPKSIMQEMDEGCTWLKRFPCRQLSILPSTLRLVRAQRGYTSPRECKCVLLGRSFCFS